MMKHCFFLSFLFIGAALGKEFNIKHFGAKADGKTDDAKAFMDTWKAACESGGPATVVVPRGNYWMGPLKFTGPCKGVPKITLKMDGHLLAEKKLDKFPTGDWVYFGWIDGLTITGNGVFDGQGSAIWHLNDCLKNEKCRLLPTNLKFVNCKNTVVTGITSANSKNFNFGVLGCENFKVRNVKVTNPGDSPNTDGMHVERCSDVSIENTVIATGDDCISLGQGLTNVYIRGITCGPGHGISVGSLGKYPDEKDVTGIIVKDSTITGTLNGVRIKSWPNSPSASTVSNVTFENIVLKDVHNPVIIDQLYCPAGSCPNQAPSKVKVRDITFRNIRGSTLSDVGVTLHCSSGFPCKNVKLEDIDIKGSKKSAVTSSCMNVKAMYKGTQFPPPCH